MRGYDGTLIIGDDALLREYVMLLYVARLIGSDNTTIR